MVRALAEINQRRLAWVLGALIVGFGVMGSLYIRDANYIDGGWVGKVDLFNRQVRGFNLDGEVNFPTAYSGLLLVAASLAGVVTATRSREIGVPPVRLVPVALLIGYMSLDEVGQFHERLETWAGVDWQTLYIPVFGLAGIIGLSLLPRLRRVGNAANLFVAGAATWTIAQIIEAFQWDAQDHLRAPWSIVPEETLEMTGSMLFLFAFLAIARHIVATHGPTRTDHADQPDQPSSISPV